MHALQRQKSLEGGQVQEVRVLRAAPEGEGASRITFSMKQKTMEEN